MNRITQTTDNIATTFRREPVRFSIVWLILAAALFGMFFGLGLVPSVSGDEDDTQEEEPLVYDQPTILADTEPTTFVPRAQADARQPIRVIIEKIGVDTVVENPTSRDINVLDQALQNGAVHYPGSATPEDNGNMFLFGHSSSLPTVRNPAYQAFNGLRHLEEGDIIRVQSQEREYIYRVNTVSLVNADEAWVDLSGTEKKLTLSTCNTFGQKQERFVVDASFLGDYQLESESLTS